MERFSYFQEECSIGYPGMGAIWQVGTVRVFGYGGTVRVQVQSNGYMYEYGYGTGMGTGAGTWYGLGYVYGHRNSGHG